MIAVSRVHFCSCFKKSALFCFQSVNWCSKVEAMKVPMLRRQTEIKYVQAEDERTRAKGGGTGRHVFKKYVVWKQDKTREKLDMNAG